MHTRHSVRWLSSVAALAAGLIGLGVPLATPAAASAAIDATPVQAAYAPGQTATIAVTTSQATNPNHLTMAVTGGKDAGNATSCTPLSGADIQFNCTFMNTHGTGTDTVIVSDSTGTTTQSAPETVSFETIAASTPQSFYGTGETVTIPVQVTGSNGSNITGSISTGSADATAVAAKQISCQNNGGGSYDCSFTNDGNTGTDTITIFDDVDPNGTSGLPDPSEPQAAALTVKFEKISITPDQARSDTTHDVLDVTVTNPRNVGPNIHEVILNGPNDAVAGCSGGGTTWTCTVVNNGRADNPVIEVYDDINSNGVPDATDPSATTTFAFETVTATDPNPNGHAPGTTATINVTLSGVPAGATPSVDYNVLSEPSPSVDPKAGVTLCQGAGTSWTCTISNTHGAGADHLQIFDDSSNDGQYETGEPVTTIDVTFGGSVTVTPTSGTFATGGTATFTAHVVAPANETPNVQWAVAVGGPDAGKAGSCTPLNGGTTDWSCAITNGGAAGVDTIDIADNASTQTPRPQAEVKATFAAASAITLTAQLVTGQHSAAIATGGCMAYAVDVTPALTFPITITASQSLGAGSGGLLGLGATAPSASLSACTPPNGNATATSSNTVANTGNFLQPNYVDTLTLTGNTGQNTAAPGRLIFGISSTTVGTVSVTAKTGSLSTAAQSFSVITGGQSAVHTLTVNPASQSATTNGSANFAVLAQDANGVPLPGVTIDYVVAAGSPDAKTAVACPTTDQNGLTTCKLTTGATTGTDSITVFAPQTTGETAPAASDPQTTAKVIVAQAPPAGSTLSLACPDELLTDANTLVPSCTVTTGNGGQQSVIFVGHVAGPTNAPLANIPVQFSIVSAPGGTTSTTGNVNTNANGNALFVVAVSNPAAGAKITVQATVGTPGSGGLGPAAAVATFQAPKPTYVTATPATQQVKPGSVVTVTGKVLDQFGAGVAGQTLIYAVGGRNTEQGQATTNGNGAATVNYTDTGTSGSDTIAVRDISSDAPTNGNPTDVTVTYGTSGGCTSNCGNNGGGVEHPALTVHQTPLGGGRTRLALVVSSRPRLVNATVVFYQVRNGVRHKIGTGHTGAKGNVTGTLRAHRGQRITFQAHVNSKAGVAGNFSNRVTVQVH